MNTKNTVTEIVPGCCGNSERDLSQTVAEMIWLMERWFPNPDLQIQTTPCYFSQLIRERKIMWTM